MIRTRLTAALLLAAFLLAACGREDDTAADANPLLGYVPTDTPYVFANLEPVPGEVMDAWLARLEPFLAEAQAGMDDLRADLDRHEGETDQQFKRVAQAVLDELDGKLNRAGIESLGLSLEAMQAIYGHGLFPVMRASLHDAQALRDTVSRVASRSGVSIPEHEHAGAKYWKISGDEDPMAAYIAIVEEHLALGFAPVAMEGEFLPVVLGLSLPAVTMTDGAALSALNREKGFTDHGSGFLDVHRAVEELLNPASTTARYLAAAGEYVAQDIHPACAAEARRVSAHVPRLAAGTTTLTAHDIGMAYHVDLGAGLAADLVRVVADVPPASDSDRYILSASLALKFGALRDFLLARSNAIVATPFQCPRLADLNRQAEQLATQLNRPLPLPFLGNLKGFRAVLESMDPLDLDPGNARGLFSLEVDKPQMLIGMASMMLPGFDQLNIEPGADPVQIPRELLTVVTPELEVHAVMSQDAIGLSLGTGMRDHLAGFMEEDRDNEGSFLSVEYDMAAMADLQRQATHRHMGDAGVSGQDPPRHADLMQAYQDILGRSRTELRFTHSGLVITSDMNFR